MGAENTHFQGKNVKFSHPGRGPPSQTLPNLSPINNCHTFCTKKKKSIMHSFIKKCPLKTQIFKAKMSNFLTQGEPLPDSPQSSSSINNRHNCFTTINGNYAIFHKNGCWKHKVLRWKCQIFSPWEGSPLPDPPQFITNQQLPNLLHNAKRQKERSIMHSFLKNGRWNTPFQGKNVKFSHPGRGTPSQTLPNSSPINNRHTFLHSSKNANLCVISNADQNINFGT